MYKQLTLEEYFGWDDPVFDEDDCLTWCPFCKYNDNNTQCCSYDEPLGRYCILGSGFQKKE